MTAARKLILAVSILHDEGLGNLRLEAGLAPSGCYWRYRLYSKTEPKTAVQGSLSNQEVMGWGDTPEMPPKDLAQVFRDKHPEIAAASTGSDSAYAEWLRKVIAASEPEGLFIEYWDSWDGKCEDVRLISCQSEATFEKPPE